jgi:excisionase family DNA binding protein
MAIIANSQPRAGAGDLAVPLLLDIKGAANLIGVTPWQLRGLVTAGELPVIRIGRKFYFRRATLTRWVEKSERMGN